MCIGLPLRVIATEPGHAMCAGRGETRRVRTALVGEVQPGDWLLVFLDSAQERITPERAAEVNATLDLLAEAMSGASYAAGAGPGGDAAFLLPSQCTTAQLRTLLGQPGPSTPTEPPAEPALT